MNDNTDNKINTTSSGKSTLEIKEHLDFKLQKMLELAISEVSIHSRSFFGELPVFINMSFQINSTKENLDQITTYQSMLQEILNKAIFNTNISGTSKLDS